jgi:hypothetical protein
MATNFTSDGFSFQLGFNDRFSQGCAARSNDSNRWAERLNFLFRPDSVHNGHQMRGALTGMVLNSEHRNISQEAW